MSRLFVVNNPNNWPLQIPGVEVVSARAYLSDAEYSDIPNAKVFNLCRTYRYMSTGYYVSLLAEARGHRAIPSILTLQDMRTDALFRLRSEDLDELIQKSLSHLKAEKYQLNMYFGKTIVKRYARLARELFSYFEAPLLRAHFVFRKKWELDQVYPIAVRDIPDWQRPFVVTAAGEYFLKLDRSPRRRKRFEYDLRDPLQSRRGRAALGRARAAEILPRRGASRHGPRPGDARRLSPHRRVRRPLHPRDDRGQPPHLPLRPPRRGRRAGGHRRPGVDHPLHEQGLPGRDSSSATGCPRRAR